MLTTERLEQPLAATKYFNHGDTEARRKKSAEEPVPRHGTVTFGRLSQSSLSHETSPCLRVSVVDSFLLTTERHGTSRKISPYKVLFASRYCDKAYELIEQVSMLKKQDNDG